MGFGNRSVNILKPLLDQAKSETQTFGKPTRKTLLDIADRLVSCAPNMYSYQSYYTDAERDEAKRILRENDLDYLCNLSPRYKARTLVLIEAEKKILSDNVAAQLEVTA